MKTEVKENETKGNVVCFGLVNNVAQANTDIKNNIENKLVAQNTTEIKSGLISFVKAYIGNKTFKYIGEYQYNKAKYEYELQQRINAIPAENITQPRLSVIGPVMDNLRYNLDEEQIREMYTNILVSEIDNRQQDKVLPAFSEIIKQISKDDALLIRSLKEIGKKNIPLCFTRVQFEGKDGYLDLDIIVVDNTKKDFSHTIMPKKIVLENLERLQIIKIMDDKTLLDDKQRVESAFNYYKAHTEIGVTDATLTYDSGILEITDFGQQFIEICCS